MGFGVNFPPLDFIAVLFILFSKNPFGALGIEKRGTYFLLTQLILRFPEKF